MLEHEDVTDWFQKGGTRRKLKLLVRNAPMYIASHGTSAFAFHTAAEMSAKPHARTCWSVPGLVADGATTNVVGQIKFAGKTTLLTHMSAAVVRGKEFLGISTKKGPVVYLTEQAWPSFRQALRRARLLKRDDFAFLLCPETIGKPWEEIARAAVKECKKRGARVLIIDTIAPFAGLAGATENDSGHVLGALRPLQAAASAGIGVVIVQHERKGGGPLVEAGRGSTAFAGAADILVSISRRKGRGQENFRELHAVSRFDETPSSLLIELKETGYVSHGAVRPIAQEKARESILAALQKSAREWMTLADLVAECGISRTTAQKGVDALLAEGLIRKAGLGKRKDAFRYRTLRDVEGNE